MTDHETILTALAVGLTVGKAARALGITLVEVRAALGETAENFRNGEHLREIWALEDVRLHRLSIKFFHKAMEGDGDCQAAVTYTKLSERRATLAGANAPIGHAVTVMHEAAPAQLNSTQRLQAAVDRIRGITTRERELDDKQRYSDEPLTVGEQAELGQLRRPERPITPVPTT